MNVGSAVSTIERNLHSHGFRAAMYDVVVRAANTLMTWKHIQCIAITEPDPKCMAVAPSYRYVKLDREALFSFSDKPEYELPREFLTRSGER